MEEITRFPNEVIQELNHYVYKLIDPRNGQVFYVGEGNGNRIFQHMKDELNCDDDDSLSLKLSTIRDIRNAGLSVIPVIHRHGMDQETAFEVEAALIDAIPGLTNIKDGHGNSEKGSASVKELITKYTTETVSFKVKVIVIKLRPATVRAYDGDVYEAGRKWWRLNKNKAEEAKLAIISVQGIIRGVFSQLKWRKAKDSKRIGFTGTEAQKKIRDKYIGKRIPKDMLNAINPTVYNY